MRREATHRRLGSLEKKIGRCFGLFSARGARYQEKNLSVSPSPKSWPKANPGPATSIVGIRKIMRDTSAETHYDSKGYLDTL